MIPLPRRRCNGPPDFSELTPWEGDTTEPFKSNHFEYFYDMVQDDFSFTSTTELGYSQWHVSGWDAHANPIYALAPVLAFNDSVHRGTGFSPFYLEFGQDPMSPISLTLGSIVDSHPDLHTNTAAFVQRLQSSVQQAQLALQKYKDHTKAPLDQTRRSRPFTVGDLV